MKAIIKKASFLVIVLTFITVPMSAQKVKKKDIKRMFVQFEQSILSKNYKKSLTFFDPDYKAEQHDGMLEGKTNQFLSEFLAGYQKRKNIMTVPELSDIKSIKLKKIKIDRPNDEAEAVLIVRLKNGKKLTSLTFLTLKSKKEIYLFGGVG